MIPAIDDYRSTFQENGIEIVIGPAKERLRENELLNLIQDVDAVICGDDEFTDGVLQSAPRLKVISKWGVGVDSIDIQAAERIGIRVYHTPGTFDDPVADTVVGYILTFARQLLGMDKDIREGLWRKRACVSLKECVLGVIGVGNIGKAVIRRAVVFGMGVLSYDIVELPQNFVAETGLKATTLEQLLSGSDFVSLNSTLTPTSYHFIGMPELRLMKETAYLINTARGSLIDEQALVEALKSGQIAGAALDVFEREPLPTDSPLRLMDNCLLAPHNANSSPSAHREVHESAIHNLLKGLNAKR